MFRIFTPRRSRRRFSRASKRGSELGFHLSLSPTVFLPSVRPSVSPSLVAATPRSLTCPLAQAPFGGLDIAKCEHRCVDDGCGGGGWGSPLCEAAVAQEDFFLQRRQHEFSPALPFSPVGFKASLLSTEAAAPLFPHVVVAVSVLVNGAMLCHHEAIQTDGGQSRCPDGVDSTR